MIGSKPVPPGVLRIRPRRLRLFTVVGAGGIVAVGVASAATLPPTNSQGFQVLPHEGWALVAVGVILGLVALVPLRIRVDADGGGIRIHNIVSDLSLPWTSVRAVKFQRGVPWATLDLITDESVAVLAVQAGDKDRAVDAIRALRALHAEAWERQVQDR